MPIIISKVNLVYKVIVLLKMVYRLHRRRRDAQDQFFLRKIVLQPMQSKK